MLEKYFQNIFAILNTSLAIFFSVGQIILSFCTYMAVGGKGGDGPRSKCIGVPAGLRDDFFYIISFYLAVLFITIFVFLIAPNKWTDKVKRLKVFFITLNIIFIAFLFFEI